MSVLNHNIQLVGDKYIISIWLSNKPYRPNRYTKLEQFETLKFGFDWEVTHYSSMVKLLTALEKDDKHRPYKVGTVSTYAIHMKCLTNYEKSKSFTSAKQAYLYYKGRVNEHKFYDAVRCYGEIEIGGEWYVIHYI